MLPNTNSVYVNHRLSVNVMKDMKVVSLTQRRQGKLSKFKYQELYKKLFVQAFSKRLTSTVYVYSIYIKIIH